jgi:4-hydroxybenzoyl-CoA reductase subunit beta
MMPLPKFDLIQPKSLQEAARILRDAKGKARILSGGTDLLVNMKHQLYPGSSDLLIYVADLPELNAVQLNSGNLEIGAGLRLSEVAKDELVHLYAPALADACGKVAHPQARNMGTLGGNICLDVRCNYVNRTPAWRTALGGCLKAEGDCCHVVEKAKRCVAALSGDSVAPLVAFNASARIVGPEGERMLPVAEIRTKDGEAPLALEPGEILASVSIPCPSEGHRRSAYHKWAVRRAVDFPLVSLAMVCDLSDDGTIMDLRIAVGALGPRPKLIKGTLKMVGKTLGEELARDVAALITKQCAPLSNLLYDIEYRRHLLAVLAKRQLIAWANGHSDPTTKPLLRSA